MVCKLLRTCTLNLHFHYTHLAFILRSACTNMNIYIVSILLPTVYSLQTLHLCTFHVYPPTYHKSATFLLGSIIWLTGFLINLQSDSILRKLRNTPPTNVYKIPTDGLFKYTSCANYFGEILEWFGYAIAGNSLAAWAFLAWGCANLIPRGLAHHAWYLSKFEDYPEDRWAVIPFII